MGLEIKDLEPISQGITEIKAEQKSNATAIGEVKELATNSKTEIAEVKKEVGTVKTEVEKVNSEVTGLKEWKENKDKADEKNQEAIDKFSIALKKGSIHVPEAKENRTFNEILGEAIERHQDEIKNFGKGDGELRIDLMPEIKSEKGKKREVKTVGDMSIGANFPGAVALYQQVGPLIQGTYNRVWLSDILPNGTSNATSILYPKENGGEGAAGLWTDRTADKPQIDYDLTSESAYFKFLAGYLIVDREMLDDIPFLQSYLQNKLLISLKTAENNFILNGSSDSNPVTGLLDAATAYDGTFTKAVDKLIDAAYGQIVEDTDEFYSGTTIILRPRDAVAIGLNTADGSGEYDLPQGSAAFAAGRLALAGLETPTTTAISSGTFIALDKSATMFVRRMQPELRIFEDSILAKKNRIMFRIEERATLAIFNNDAIVEGTLGAGSS